MKQLVKDKIIDTTKVGLYSKETAEILPDDSFGELMGRKRQNKVQINSKEYVYLDINRLNYLVSNGIKTSTLGFLFKIVPFAEMITNKLITDEGTPQTSGSLSKAIGMRQQSVIRSLKELVDLDLIALHKSLKKGERQFYCLNPYLIRRGASVSNLLPELFNDPLPKPTELGRKKKISK